ncbi:MAG TPA: acyl-CoA dehydrogenase [Thermoanaerobaculia bacterium]|nr:acyl-CoA dehydrogenase [Thermoanaerobaculia bacterium]
MPRYTLPMSTFLIRAARRRNLIPRISETERQALEAGTVWVDGELFSGRPDFRRMLREPYPILADEERAFLDGPVERLCALVDDWEVSRRRELPPKVWDLLKEERFFGLAIPREHGGHGFSPLALSTIFGTLASRSLALSAVVLIPNSVGPGELLLEYGTPEQQAFFLPRLARGEEIPCFALTEPEAGSDAASLRSEGVLFRDSKGDLAIRLSWSKRYITLAPVATLLGLAFRLRDPENLLGRGEDVGITLALVPTHLPGVRIGDRHDPMGVPFPNGPTEGRDVVIPADRIIGGPEYAGRGWKMLMEALSAGRSISLPAQSVGGAKYVARVAGAYAAVRRQFGVEIGRFEGIEEPLARIGGLTWLMEAARVATCGAVGSGHRPAVISGVVKYQQTELLRRVVQDGMDVLGGAALSRGPRNLMAAAHMGAPIGITVEGANILTRTLIVFGQGAIRCHPYALAEIRALESGDAAALRKALLGHAGSFLRNLVRSALLGLTRGRLAGSPVAGPTAGSWRRLAWASARFALLTDLALLSLGSRLKLREKLAGRFADALSWMYLGFCALRRFEAEGRREEDLPFVLWATEHALDQIQTAFEGIYRNFEGPLGWLMRGPGAWWCRVNPLGRPPSDRRGARVAAALRSAGALRDRLTAGVFLPADPTQALGRLERAFALVAEAAPVAETIARASRQGTLPAGRPEELLDWAVAAGVVTAEQAGLVRRAAEARLDAIQVDSFGLEEYLRLERPKAAPAEAVQLS